MAPSLSSLYTKTLSLSSLFSLLLFLHMLGSSARENSPYIPRYINQKKVDKLNYLTGCHHSQNDKKEKGEPYEAAYAYRETKKDNQLYITQYGDDKKVSRSYLIGYIHSQNDNKEKDEPSVATYGKAKSENKPYITAYGSDKRVSQSYLTGYIQSQKDQKEKNKPYVTTYGESKRESQPYITGYVNDKTVSQSYLTGYLHSQNDREEKSEPYITSYGKSKRESQPYITGYINNKKVSQSYLTGYFHSKKDKKEKSEPYITSYKATERKNQPYITVYGAGKKMSQSYLTDYLHPKKDKKETSESYETADGESKMENRPYITAYGGSKKDSQGENPKESYAATYRKKESGNTDAVINKVDHTEAFKTGFFAIDDLFVGNTMTLQFPIEEFPHFLTKKEADPIPFSTSQLPSVLQLFSVPQDSAEAQAMSGTLEQCELQSLTAETKVCVSSLESMIDFVRSIIGSDSQLDILTTTLPATSSFPLQNFTVLEISPDFYAPKWVACHPLPYPYAVFYCHFIGSGTKIFKVKLGSENGEEQVEALGVCHLDTSEWSADHVLFKQLGFKPGDAPVCHFFPVKHLMWIPLPSKAAM